jgi:hypothetical protein
MGLVVAQADVGRTGGPPRAAAILRRSSNKSFRVVRFGFRWWESDALAALDSGATAKMDAPIAPTTRAFASRAILLRRLSSFRACLQPERSDAFIP